MHRRAPKWDTSNATPRTQSKGDKALNPRSSPTLTPFRAEGRDKTAKHCLRDKYNHGTKLAMKVVRQARLELSGGSTPDQLRPHIQLGKNDLVIIVHDD